MGKIRFRNFFEAALMLAVAAIPIGAVLMLADDTVERELVATAKTTAGIVAGVLLLVAGLLSYFLWRTAPDPRQGWVVAATVLVSGEVFVNAAAIQSPRHLDAVNSGWPLVHETITMALVMGLCLIALRTTAVRMLDPLLIGIALVVAVAGLRVAFLSFDTGFPDVVVAALAVSLVAGHVLIAGVVMCNQRLPRWGRWRLAATIVLVGLGHVAGLSPFERELAGLTSATVLTAAGVLWTSATFVLLREAVEAQRSRAVELEGSLLEVETASRGAREQLHEVKSIVAGLSCATRLLQDHGLPEDVRGRLERTIGSELGRLERVVTASRPEPGTLDLDEVLDAVLQLHRARGRTIDWEPSGVRVLGQIDAVAEAVNILLENAAAHGGDAGSRVAVQTDPLDDVVRIRVSDEGPGIPEDIRAHVFDWGVGRSGTPGQGIGLNLARRLVTEQGGTITLDEPALRGSAFVIRLPAARRSEESINDPAGR